MSALRWVTVALLGLLVGILLSRAMSPQESVKAARYQLMEIKALGVTFTDQQTGRVWVLGASKTGEWVEVLTPASKGASHFASQD
jgi:hypothetical protein